MGDIEENFSRRQAEAKTLPSLPKFLYYDDGRFRLGAIPDANVTGDLIAFLQEQGKSMPGDDNLPGFLYKQDGEVLRSGGDDQDVRGEWERWLASCPSQKRNKLPQKLI